MTTYNPTVHAVQRIRERFGIMEVHAKNFVNQLMQTAIYVTTSKNGCKVYKHSGKDILLVIDPKDDIVVTVHPATYETKAEETTPLRMSVNNVIIAKARATINREITKARREFTREFRSLSESQALIQIEIAEMSLRKVRAKNPNTQAVIQAKIDVALDVFDEIGIAIGELKTEFTKVEREASEFLPI